MKRIVFLSTLLVLSVQASQQSVSQGLSVSVFWQIPPATDDAQLMFSTDSLQSLQSAYTNNHTLFNKKSINPTKVNGYSSPLLTQYILGSYFGVSNASNFFVALSQKIAPKTHKGLKPSHMITLSRLRLACVAIRDAGPVPGVDSFQGTAMKIVYGDGFPMNITLGKKTFTVEYMNKTYGSLSPQVSAYIYEYTMAEKGIMFVIKAIDTQAETAFSVHKFSPVAALNMQINTYFEQDEILFALHLITPGRTTKINGGTSLENVITEQNTYTDMYSKEGYPECGDTFGF